VAGSCECRDEPSVSGALELVSRLDILFGTNNLKLFMMPSMNSVTDDFSLSFGV
jgi:hypothetical protein